MEWHLMSFNIRCFTKKDTEFHNWEKRKDALIRWLGQCGADVICLQEVRKNQCADIIEGIDPRFGVIWYGRDDSENREGLMTLYDKNLFTAEEDRVFWLSQTPEIPSIGWGAKLPRICVSTRLCHRQTGETLNVYNVHLDHGEADDPRTEGIRLVLERAKEVSGPAVVAGDFNCRDTSACYRVIAGEMKDCRFAAGQTDQGVTFHGWGTRTEGSPIDFLFVPQTASVRFFAIRRDTWGEGYHYSDHYAITAAVDFT